jgi:predicted DsbA family dithiol-disulfide isomerase
MGDPGGRRKHRGVVPSRAVNDLSLVMPKDTPTAPVFYFDFVDPVSYLLDGEVSAVEEALDVQVARVGVEINPPPHPLGAPDDAIWGPRWDDAERIADSLGAVLRRPRLVPWTRKAHELMEHLHEGHESLVPELRKKLMTAFIVDHHDIGRVDVLVEVAGQLGLDRTETKAVLDVDRYDEAIERRRRQVVEAGLRVVPTVAMGGRRLEGFHNRASLSTLLSDVLSSS